jgi:Phage integrase family
VDRLQDAARKHSRYGHRDATAILIAYRHGLRASELCELTWNMIELDSGMLTYWLTRCHPKAATGHPERADCRRCHREGNNVDPATISRLAAASPFEHGAVAVAQ